MFSGYFRRLFVTARAGDIPQRTVCVHSGDGLQKACCLNISVCNHARGPTPRQNLTLYKELSGTISRSSGLSRL